MVSGIVPQQMGPPGSEVRERAAAYHAKNKTTTGRMTNAAKF
jgi:hypothetical protein